MHFIKSEAKVDVQQVETRNLHNVCQSIGIAAPIFQCTSTVNVITKTFILNCNIEFDCLSDAWKMHDFKLVSLYSIVDFCEREKKRQKKMAELIFFINLTQLKWKKQKRMELLCKKCVQRLGIVEMSKSMVVERSYFGVYSCCCWMLLLNVQFIWHPLYEIMFSTH